MNCEEFSARIHLDPHDEEPGLHAHASECEKCRSEWARMLKVEQALREAVKMEVAPELTANVLQNMNRPSRFVRYRWIGAMVATVLLTISLGAIYLAGNLKVASNVAFSEVVIRHVEAEPQAMQSEQVIDQQQISVLMKKLDIVQTRPIHQVIYAENCLIGTMKGLHLVLLMKGEPVTVLLMPQQASQQPQPIDGNGYHGLLLPMSKGSVAIVGEQESVLQPVAELIRDSIMWGV
ncbi:MAG: DUF3379 family protein [bacterium]